MIICKQGTKEIDGKLIAYVETKIKIGDYTYSVKFDDKTRKRFNTMLKKEGFTIGQVTDEPCAKECAY